MDSTELWSQDPGGHDQILIKVHALPGFARPVSVSSWCGAAREAGYASWLNEPPWDLVKLKGVLGTILSLAAYVASGR